MPINSVQINVMIVSNVFLSAHL